MKQHIRRVWRCLPSGLRRLALRILTTVLTRPLDPSRERFKGDIVVAGFHGTATGLGESARQMLRQFQLRKLSVHAANVSRFAIMEDFQGGDLWPLAASTGGIVIFHVNPDMLNLVMSAIGRKHLIPRRIVGLWAWELGTVPSQWAEALASVDEAWVPSHFIADGLRKISGDKPVHVIPNAVDVAAMPMQPSQDPLPEFAGRTLVFFMYDVRSNHARKNPEAVIEAFRRATVGDTQAVLVLKINNDHAWPESLRRVQDAMHDMTNVHIIREKLTPTTMKDLIARMDIILSLHRAEGFGFLMAEGMAAAKPVIATGWSGNTDFMTKDCTVLVDCKLVPVDDPEHVYDKYNAVWADPDINQAAQALQRLLNDPAERQRMGQAAREHIADYMSSQRWMGALPLSFWQSLQDSETKPRIM